MQKLTCATSKILHNMKIMDIEIVPAQWSDYKRFVNLCCVSSLPFPRGKCWIIKDDIGFIGYNYPYRFNHQRFRLFPQCIKYGNRYNLKYLNTNFRILNRVMIRPKYRGQGLATKLVQQTLPLVGVPYIECLTFAELIKNILVRTGFIFYGKTNNNKCSYYLYHNIVPPLQS